MVKTIFSPENAYGYWNLAIVSETFTTEDILHSSERPIKGKFSIIGEIAGKTVVRIEKDEKSTYFIVVKENDSEVPFKSYNDGAHQFDYSFIEELSEDVPGGSETDQIVGSFSNETVSIFILGENSIITNCNEENRKNISRNDAKAYKYTNGVLVDCDVYAIFGNLDFENKPEFVIEKIEKENTVKTIKKTVKNVNNK